MNPIHISDNNIFFINHIENSHYVDNICKYDTNIFELLDKSTACICLEGLYCQIVYTFKMKQYPESDVDIVFIEKHGDKEYTSAVYRYNSEQNNIQRIKI